MKLTSTLMFVVLACAAAHAQDQPPGCAWGEHALRREIAKYKVIIEPVAKPLGPSSENGDCVVKVLDAKGKTLFQRVGFVVSLSHQGQLDGNEGTFAVFEAFSGGAHCCWTYWFVSLGESPGRFIQLENDRPATFETDFTGRTLVRTLDGAFDYFDGLCHACTVFPYVMLQLQGRRLVNVSNSFAADYDKEIADAKQIFEREDGEEFAALREYQPGTSDKYIQARESALTVILAFLYSGREQQAWQALERSWPTSDQARLKKLILQTRATGVLSSIKYADRKP